MIKLYGNKWLRGLFVMGFIKEKLTSAEMGKLWVTYMGNSMSKRVLSYYFQHVEDQDIKKLLKTH